MTSQSTFYIFVAGKLINPLNGSFGHWSKHARIARRWREATAMQVFLAGLGQRQALGSPSDPKCITFTAHTGSTWDDDNLPGAIKPIRDGLKDARIIDDDKPSSGHRFVYRQRIDRKKPGVTITIVARTA